MKVLFLTPQLPYPLDQGTKLRNYHLIRIAAEGGHDVDLVTFTPDGPRFGQESTIGPPPLERWCRRIVHLPAPRPRPPLRRAASIVGSGLPDLVLRLRSGLFAEAVRRLLASERYEVVQIEGLELSPYLALVRGPRAVFDDHNVEFLLQRRAWETDRRRPRRAHAALYSFLQQRRLRGWEARVCRTADAVLAVSDRDASILADLGGRPVTTVLNGVDLAAFRFEPPEGQIRPTLLFDGTMRFRPNADAALWFGREILPLVRRSSPDARLWVVGRDPLPALTALNFGSNGVAVTGTVPNTAPYWERSDIYVLPMRIGGGSRFKALEAMARGRPIVSTALGMEGTPAVAGRDFLPAETPREFADAIRRLLGDAALARTLAGNARRTVAAHAWSRVAPRLLAVYDRLAGPRPGPSPTAGR